MNRRPLVGAAALAVALTCTAPLTAHASTTADSAPAALTSSAGGAHGTTERAGSVPRTAGTADAVTVTSYDRGRDSVVVRAKSRKAGFITMQLLDGTVLDAEQSTSWNDSLRFSAEAIGADATRVRFVNSNPDTEPVVWEVPSAEDARPAAPTVSVVDRTADTATLAVDVHRPGDVVVRDASGAVVARQSVSVLGPPLRVTVRGLTSGAQTLSVSFVVLGNASDPSAQPITSPGTPVRIAAFDGADTTTFVPLSVTSDGTYAEDGEATVAGVATPGATVVVRIPGIPFTETLRADGRDGSWSTTTPQLRSGTFDGTVLQASAAGSDRLDFTLTPTDQYVDPYPDAPYRALEVTTPTTYRDGDEITIGGVASPGAKVVVRLPGYTNAFVLTTIADEDGAWSFDSPPLHGSFLRNSAQQFSAKGNSAPLFFDIEAQLEVTAPAAGSTVRTDRPVFTGVGTHGASVVVTDDDGRELGRTTVGDDGRWSVVSDLPLADGHRTAHVEQTPAV